VYIFFSESGLR